MLQKLLMSFKANTPRNTPIKMMSFAFFGQKQQDTMVGGDFKQKGKSWGMNGKNIL